MSNGEVIALAVVASFGAVLMVSAAVSEWKSQRRREIDFAFARGYREGYGESTRGLPPKDLP